MKVLLFQFWTASLFAQDVEPTEYMITPIHKSNEESYLFSTFATEYCIFIFDDFWWHRYCLPDANFLLMQNINKVKMVS